VYILGIVIPNFVTYYILFRLFDGVFEYKYLRKYYPGMYLGVAAVQCIVVSLGIPFLSLVIFVGYAVSMSAFAYKSENNKLLYTALILIYLTFIDMAAVSLFSYVVNVTIKQTIEGDEYFFLTGMLNAAVGISSYRGVLWALLRYKTEVMKKSQDIFIIFLGCFEIGLAHIILQLNDYNLKEINLVATGLCGGFFVIDAYLLASFKNTSHRNKLQIQNCLYEQESKMNERYIEIIRMQNEDYRKTMHDIKKHLRIMKQLKSVDDKYCDEVLSLVKWNGMEFKCSDRVLNTVLVDRLSVCEEKKIKVELDIDDVNLDFMEKSDITIIFMNLLDNAIEACEDAADKVIEIKIRNVQGNIVIVIRNSWDGNIIVPDISGISTKKGHMGLGLSNVKKSLARYSTKLEVEKKNHTFTAKCVILRDGD
jgi:Signal transduction histidine kinase regulating citrate/malate metabolism